MGVKMIIAKLRHNDLRVATNFRPALPQFRTRQRKRLRKRFNLSKGVKSARCVHLAALKSLNILKLKGDVAVLSRRRQGFKSPWGRQLYQAVSLPGPPLCPN
jgi:hypothetical protein